MEQQLQKWNKFEGFSTSSFYVIALTIVFFFHQRSAHSLFSYVWTLRVLFVMYKILIFYNMHRNGWKRVEDFWFTRCTRLRCRCMNFSYNCKDSLSWRPETTNLSRHGYDFIIEKVEECNFQFSRCSIWSLCNINLSLVLTAFLA